MSGLFRRLSSRRSAGPDGVEPAAQAEPGTADAPTTTPTDSGGHRSLLADPAAETVILVAHGPNGDADNRLCLEKMARLADFIRNRGGFRRVEELGDLPPAARR